MDREFDLRGCAVYMDRDISGSSGEMPSLTGRAWVIETCKDSIKSGDVVCQAMCRGEAGC